MNDTEIIEIFAMPCEVYRKGNIFSISLSLATIKMFLLEAGYEVVPVVTNSVGDCYGSE